MHPPSVPLLLLLAVSLAAAIHGAYGEEDLASKCGDAFQKLSDCLAYATAKTDAPSDKCCEATTAIRAGNPVCLCYIIQQSQKTSGTASIGLQYTRILKLPDLCNIKGANASLCPVLLHIPPGSPDYAIFNGSAKPPVSNFTTSSHGSAGQMHWGSLVAAVATAVASSLF